jgi:hypothetical protein
MLDGAVDLHRWSSLGAPESSRRGGQVWRFCF